MNISRYRFFPPSEVVDAVRVMHQNYPPSVLFLAKVAEHAFFPHCTNYGGRIYSAVLPDPHPWLLEELNEH